MRLHAPRDELLAPSYRSVATGRRGLGLALALLLASSACSSPLWREGHTFLYAFETAAGTSYLLGTSHVGIAWDELPPEVEEALGAVGAVGFETEPSAPIDDAVLFELGLIPRYEPILSQRLTPEVWDELEKALLGRVDEVRLRRFRPWLARFALGLVFIEGLPRLEVELESEAQRLGRSLFHLETQREQLEVLASIPEDEVLAALILMTTDPDGARRELDETIAAFRQADAAHFERTFLEPSDSAEVELLIRARNRRWLQPIKSRFESGPTLLAVGAAHLVGPEGLLRLLEAEGLSPKPVPPGP